MLALKIVMCWILVSLTVGPIFSWAFFYPIRREHQMTLSILT
jgi:hypothetical protein